MPATITTGLNLFHLTKFHNSLNSFNQLPMRLVLQEAQINQHFYVKKIIKSYIKSLLHDLIYKFMNYRTLGFRGRVEEVLTYFNSKDASTHPDLVLIYLEQPDSAGHDQGPYGDWVGWQYWSSFASCMIRSLDRFKEIWPW